MKTSKVTKSVKIKTKKTTRKPRAKVVVEQIKESKYSFELFLWWTFKIITLPFYMVYLVLFKIPPESSRLLGVFRFVVFFSIINYGQTIFDSNREYLEFASTHLYLNEMFATLLSLSVMILIMGGFFMSLLIMCGVSRSPVYRQSYGEEGGNGNFNNIREALEFRDGVLCQKSTTDKMEEMGKTGFVTYSNFQKPMSSNEREAFEYLDGQLSMCSTSGKYDKLKELYGKK